MMSNTSKLQILSEKTLHHPVNGDLIDYCPSMDLIALGTTDSQVLVYRLNGQRVYGATQKTSTVIVTCLTWKPNGQLLAIGWTDGQVRLIGAESTKVVHQFTVGNKTGVTCIGWASNLTRKVKDQSGSQQRFGLWKDLLRDGGRTFGKYKPLDLPRDLSQIEIESSLPKLSVLASGGGSEEAFSSRASLDALFQSRDPDDDSTVDVMVIGMLNGQIQLSIYDSFVIGTFPSPLAQNNIFAQLLLHASNEEYSTHALLMKDLKHKLYLVPMDLRFVSVSSDYLSLLASRSTALHNLLRYIREVQKMMVSEWRSTIDLPGKFLGNINETLAEKGDQDIVQSLYHSVATGHTFPAVKEWLVDELSERGHKRWDKAVTTGLENLKQLVHENMLPALDRCALILSRFAGIAKFRANYVIGFSSQQIKQLSETVACLHLVSSKILVQVVDELDLFLSFSSWLRYEIDRLASSSSAAFNDDTVDKESSIDHSKVLLYLQTVINVSPLALYFEDSSEDELAESWKHIEQGTPIFDALDDQMSRHHKTSQNTPPLCRVSLLCNILTKQSDTIFAQIAEAEKRNVLFGKPQEIGSTLNNSPMDMKMYGKSPSDCETYIVFLPNNGLSLVQIVRAELSIKNGISSISGIDTAVIKLGSGLVMDIKLFDHIILVVWNYNGKTRLLSIPYRESDNPNIESNAIPMQYTSLAQKSTALHPAEYSNREVLFKFHEYHIPGARFGPQRLHVRDRRNDSNSARLVVLGQNKLHYKVLQFAADAEAKDDEQMSTP